VRSEVSGSLQPRMINNAGRIRIKRRWQDTICVFCCGDYCNFLCKGIEHYQKERSLEADR